MSNIYQLLVKHLVQKSLLIVFTITLFGNSYGQSREFIRESIQKYGECRNVAITERNGDLMLYGRNGYATNGCPSELYQALKDLNNQKVYIDDVQLTEGGDWLILYDINGIRWSNIPYSLEKKLKQFNNNQEEITSVTFNDGGDWVVITTEHISASADWIQDWLVEGLNRHGQLWAVCITSDTMVAVYEKGYKFYGNVPSELRNALRDTKLNVYRLKIAGDSWFFADKNGRYQYHM